MKSDKMIGSARKIGLIEAFFLTFAFTASHTGAQILIDEHFDEGRTVYGVDGYSISNAPGWHGLATVSAANNGFAAGTVADYTPFVQPGNGNGNAVPCLDGTTAGYNGSGSYAIPGAAAYVTNTLVYVDSLPALHNYTVTNVCFQSKNTGASTKQQVAVMIGSQWYASTTALSDSGAAAVWVSNNFLFSTAESAWQMLNTNTLTVGNTNTSVLPFGDVSEIGLFGMIPSGGKIRLDEFIVSGTPALPQVNQPTVLPAATVSAPTTVTLSVSPGGPPPFTYAWRRNTIFTTDGPTGTGSTYTGSATDQLEILNTSTNDSGSYDVVVGNTAGMITSAVQTITVTSQKLSPSISNIVVNPTNSPIEVGSTPVIITVTASGTGPLTYQWQKAGVSIPNATNSALTFAANFTNAGSYTVVVSNVVNVVTSSPPTVLVFQDTTPPAIVLNGSLVTNIAVNSFWSEPGYTVTDNSGETPPVLVMGSVNTNICGSYTLTYSAIDSHGNTGTATRTVNVWLIYEPFNESGADNGAIGQAPGWHDLAVNSATGQVQDFSGYIGANGNDPTLSQNVNNPGADGNPGYLVAGDSGVAGPSLVWKDTSIPLDDQQITNITFYSHNNSSGSTMQVALLIDGQWYASTNGLSDTTTDAGPWAFQSFNFTNDPNAWQTLDPSLLALGNALTKPLATNSVVSGVGFYCVMPSGKVRLDQVQALGSQATFPPWAGQLSVSPLNPADGTAWSVSPLTFQASVSGTPPISYLWQKNGVSLTNGHNNTGSTFAGSTSGQFVISNTTADDSGNYDLVVSNAYGSFTSAVLTVTVSPVQLVLNEHFNEATNLAATYAVVAAAGWHALALSSNGTVVDYTSIPNPPVNGNFPCLGNEPSADDIGLGYLILGRSDTVNPVLEWTDTTVLLDSVQITNVSFFTLNNDPSVTEQFVVCIGGQWYISATTESDNTFGAPPWAPQSTTFNTGPNNWFSLNTNTLQIGNQITTALPNLSVTGIGFYGIEPISGVFESMRVDELEVSAVPFAYPPYAPQPTASPLNPVDGSAWVGFPLTLQVAASGTFPLVYQWRLNGTNITGAVSNPLVLPNVSVSNAGNYDVIVNNSYGATTSAVLTVNVELPPTAPTILPVYPDGLGNLVFRVSTVVGQPYVLESTPVLELPGTWTIIQTNTGTGGVITNTVPFNPAIPTQFFRYIVQ